MKKIILHFLVFVMLFISLQSVEVKAETFTSASVGYSTYIMDEGWSSEAYGGGLSGSESGKSLQSIRIFLMDEPNGAGIKYRTYVQSQGWQEWVFNGADSNNPNNITGIQVQLDNYPNGSVHYQVLIHDVGWTSWKHNGTTAGNLTGTIDAIRIKVFEVGVNYQVLSSSNWLSIRHNGETIGNEGSSVQALKVNLESAPTSAKVVYRTHNTSDVWSNWSSNNASVGSGSIDGIEIKLEGLPEFSVAYQVLIQNNGWSDWYYDGMTAGFINQNQRIEGIRIKIVKLKVIPREVVVEEDDGFDFGDDTGEGCFSSYLDTSESTVIGVIPAGVTNVRIQLTSEVDVDLEIYDGSTYGLNPIILYDSEDSYFDVDDGNPVEGWYPFEDSYLYISYSGWYGVDGNYGNEFIYIYGTLQNPILIAAYNYEDGANIQVCYEYGFELPN